MIAPPTETSETSKIEVDTFIEIKAPASAESSEKSIPSIRIGENLKACHEAGDPDIKNKEFHVDKDFTGLRTWGVTERYIRRAIAESKHFILKEKNIVELGSGTGVGGLIVAQSHPSAHIILTEGNSKTFGLLEHNVNENKKLLPNILAVPLRWGDLDGLSEIRKQMKKISGKDHIDFVIASEIFYSINQLGPLLSTVVALLKENSGARFVLLHMVRRIEVYLTMKAMATEAGLVLEINEEVGDTRGDSVSVIRLIIWKYKSITS